MKHEEARAIIGILLGMEYDAEVLVPMKQLYDRLPSMDWAMIAVYAPFPHRAWDTRIDEGDLRR